MSNARTISPPIRDWSTGRREPIPVRLIDPRGQRFGAGTSATTLAVAFVLGLVPVVPLVGIALAVSALFGTRYFVFGRPWPAIRERLRLGPPARPEPELPPRFAQALGALGLGLSSVLLALGLGLVGWLPALAVAALQGVLAVTGFCLGCRLYGLHWAIPAAFDRLARVTTRE